VFTGLVQAVALVVSNEDQTLTVEFEVPVSDLPVELGESVAVNGCCLTVVEALSAQYDDSKPETVSLSFEMSQETLDRTNLGALGPGARVNVERAMRPIDRFGGHIVQGHVDATGKVVSRREEGEFTVFRFAVPVAYDRYLIDKGSVAIDGISLTVVEPEKGEFDVWIIPHTLQHTTLSGRQAGDPVNLEFDALAKYVEKLIQARI